MKNQSITISWVAKRFSISKDLVKKWVLLFSEYLSIEATSKGKTRTFTLFDLQVLTVINHVHDWQDDDGDYSDVHSAIYEGLPNEEPFLSSAYFNYPIFQEPPQDLDEGKRHGILLGGIGTSDTLWLAQAYKTAGDVLVDQAIEDQNAWLISYPILFNYRHSIELFLKLNNGSTEKTHQIDDLLKDLEFKLGAEANRWAKDFLMELHRVDKKSTTFRYGENLPYTEKWIDLNQLKKVVGLFASEMEHLFRKGLT
jgi:hypothetical protein